MSYAGVIFFFIVGILVLAVSAALSTSRLEGCAVKRQKGPAGSLGVFPLVLA